MSADILERAAAAFEVLARLAPEHRDLVRSQGRTVEMPAGGYLFRPGDRCEGLGFVVEGSVKVSVLSESGREMVLYRVRPGESCTVTASCLVSDTLFAAQGVAEESVTALAMPRPVFDALFESSPVFRRFVLEIFSGRITLLMELVNEVAFNKLDRRLGARLLELGPVVSMSHQELAEELGTTREIVSRILESLADAGAVSLGRRRITVVNRERLQMP